MQEYRTKVFILGAGAGGFGAAHTFGKNQVPYVIADVNPGFGGNAVYGGVCCFEPGVSLDGVHSRLAALLLQNGGGEVQKTVPSHLLFQGGEPRPYPWGLSVKCADGYGATLKRCRQYCRDASEWRRFMTDETALASAMQTLIDENGRYCTPLFGFCYAGCETENGRIKSVILRKGGENVKIYAEHFLDCSGSIVLARDAGCDYAFGDEEGRLSGINGVSFVFRVSKRPGTVGLSEEELPKDEDFTEGRMRQVVSCFNMYPDGDINVNMLPTMSGEEWFRLGKDAIAVGHGRVWRYWRYIGETYGLADYKIVRIFSPGIREDYRLRGRKLLTCADILAPFDKTADYIAVADHALDTHGVVDRHISELSHPYGIPLDCARPKEYENLFIACRGASFSHTVASSARLTRTMISMGEGVARVICRNR